MCGYVDERFALLQAAISERADTEQTRETISNELRNVVQESQDCRATNNIDAIREEVAKTVQEQVSETVFAARSTTRYDKRSRVYLW